MRKLTKEEVEFEFEVEPEDCIVVEGNVMASGDDAFDKECEKEIIDRLNRGDAGAWCVIIVKAKWSIDRTKSIRTGPESFHLRHVALKFEGVDSLGGVTLAATMPGPAEKEARELAEQHGMFDNALADLNNAIQNVVEDGEYLSRYFKDEQLELPVGGAS